MRKLFFFSMLVIMILSSCSSAKKTNKVNVLSGDGRSETSAAKNTGEIKSKTAVKPMLTMDKPLDIDRREFLNYTRKFLNVPYLYASADPEKGFDCSGLLYHVFKHFNVRAPRSSYNYENIGKEVLPEKAKQGDLILFTASDSTKIGHIGIIAETEPKLSFIHASTSKGVIISPLSGYYLQHFVKVIRVLK